FSFHSQAQSLVKDSVMSALLLEFNYGFYMPGADLKARFGNSSLIGPSMKYKFGKNFVLGAEAFFMFGGNVKEADILRGIVTEQGNLIGSNGLLESYTLSERGLLIKGEFGKIISFGSPNPNSGIYVAVGCGFFQHKIRIETDPEQVPQLSKEYKKGYDRLSNGIAISQFIGYRYFTSYKFLNLYGGFEIIEGFTQNRRKWNFD